LLSELMRELGGEAALFVSSEGHRLAGASSDPRLNLAEFESRSAPSIKAALEGQSNVDTAQVGERLFDVVSVPVTVGESLVGVVIFGAEIGQRVAEEFQQLTHSEIAFLIGDRLAITTLHRPELEETLASRFSNNLESPLHGKGNARNRIQKITLGDEHFVGFTGQFPSRSENSRLGYLLLSSYERPLQMLRATQRLLGLVRLFGILLST